MAIEFEDMIKNIASRVRPTEKRSTSKNLEKRLVSAAGSISDGKSELTYQHTALCQISLPYRDPGDDKREWHRQNGSLHLHLTAGTALHPDGDWRQLGLPYGPKPRLLLAYLNTIAIRTQSPEIDVGRSLTGFVRRMGLDPTGRNLDTVRDQLARLAAASIRFGLIEDGRAMTVNAQVVELTTVWFEKTNNNRVMWPRELVLSPAYFASLVKHAVPLNEVSLAALSHSAMALDLYAWLAQRLNRVAPGNRVTVYWTELQQQFGAGYAQLRDFRRKFRTALNEVLTQYREAKVELTPAGMVLRYSPAPVRRTMVLIPPAPPEQP